MSKLQELHIEINLLKQTITKLKAEGLDLLKEKEALIIANNSAQARIEYLEKKIREFERLLGR